MFPPLHSTQTFELERVNWHITQSQKTVYLDTKYWCDPLRDLLEGLSSSPTELERLVLLHQVVSEARLLS
jgi:hypothetical protein